MHTDRSQVDDDAVSRIRYAEQYQLHECLTLERCRVFLSAGRLQQLLPVALLLLLAHLAAVQSNGGESRKLQMSSCTSCVAVCCMQMRICARITISTQCSLLHSFVASTVALRRHNVSRPVRLADILWEANAPRHLPHAAAMHVVQWLHRESEPQVAFSALLVDSIDSVLLMSACALHMPFSAQAAFACAAMKCAVVLSAGGGTSTRRHWQRNGHASFAQSAECTESRLCGSLLCGCMHCVPCRHWGEPLRRIIISAPARLLRWLNHT